LICKPVTRQANAAVTGRGEQREPRSAGLQSWAGHVPPLRFRIILFQTPCLLLEHPAARALKKLDQYALPVMRVDQGAYLPVVREVMCRTEEADALFR